MSNSSSPWESPTESSSSDDLENRKLRKVVLTAEEWDGLEKDSSTSNPELHGLVQQIPYNPSELVEITSIAKIVECFKCSGCNKFPLSDTYGCEEDHLICHECFNKENFEKKSHWSCPALRNQTGSAVEDKRVKCGTKLWISHLGPIKQIYLTASFTCPNENCLEVLKGYQVKEHALQCGYRTMVKCHFSACKDKPKIALGKYLNHLKEEHKVPHIKDDFNNESMTLTVKLSSGLRDQSYPKSSVIGILEAFGRIFAYILQENEVEFWLGCVIIDQVDRSGKSFKCHFEFNISQDGDNIRRSWYGPVTTIEGKCTPFGDSTVEWDDPYIEPGGQAKVPFTSYGSGFNPAFPHSSGPSPCLPFKRGLKELPLMKKRLPDKYISRMSIPTFGNLADGFIIRKNIFLTAFLHEGLDMNFDSFKIKSIIKPPWKVVNGRGQPLLKCDKKFYKSFEAEEIDEE